MRRTGVPIAALLLLTGSTGAFALQTPGNKLTAAQLAGQQVVHANPDIAKMGGVLTPPLKQVCVEGPCNDTSPTTNQTNPSGTEPTNVATNTVEAPPGATNTTTNEPATNEENATHVVAQNNGVIVDPPFPPQPNYWPLIAAIGAIVLLAAAAGIGLYRHNILVKTRGLLSLRTTLAQPRMPSPEPSINVAWPPLSIRTRVEEGVTEYG